MALSMDDLKALRARMTPGNSRFRITGAVTQAQAMASLAPIAAGWTGTGTPLASLASPPAPSKARLYFYDIPDAKQSTLMFTAPGPRRADPEYYPATVLNYTLGGGGFASRLTQSLREGKGYTYGIRSRFEGYRDHGRFTIESPVRANVTLEAAELTRQITADYGRTFTSADLDVTKAYLTKSRAFSFESPMSKLSMLALIGDYGLPLDYPAREAGVVEAMSIERIRDLAATWLQTGHMTYVIVGDAATQAKRLDALGLGPAVSAKPLID
jgi:zinc protease